jgi:hypothetical protein
LIGVGHHDFGIWEREKMFNCPGHYLMRNPHEKPVRRLKDATRDLPKHSKTQDIDTQIGATIHGVQSLR